MRAYSLLMIVGLVSMVLFGLQLSVLPITAPDITADVKIVPEVFNVKRKDAHGGVITAYISNLTEGEVSYDVHDVNVSTIGLYYEGSLIAEAIPGMVKIANDKLVAKFDATQIASYIWVNIVYHLGNIPPQENYPLKLTVSGELFTHEQFAGSDIIKIIYL